MAATTERPGTALVTGASSGIGHELATLFAADGWKLLLVARSRDDLETVADELVDAHGVPVHVFPQDLSTAAGAEALYEAVTDADHEVDALVNNAGFGSYGDFLEDDADTDDALIGLHAAAVTRLTKLFGREMAAGDGGYVLNTASVAGWAPSPGSAVYSAAKHYERAFSEAIAEEFEAEGITVTALCPGETATGFFDRGDYGASGAASAPMMSAAEVAAVGYEGLMNGDRIVVPGARNKLRVLLGRLLPRSLYVKAAGRSIRD
ncbi:MAG: SDR family NAD(P)-dependent oxidoreductase [Halolamina sp.]